MHLSPSKNPMKITRLFFCSNALQIHYDGVNTNQQKQVHPVLYLSAEKTWF